MTISKKLSTALAVASVALVGMTGQAMAQDHGWSYDRTGPGASHDGNKLEFFELNYAKIQNQEYFSGSFDFKPEITKTGGFWLVLSDGPNPKGHKREYAIMYADLTQNRLSIFEYNGQNNTNSLNNPGNQLAVIENAFTIDNALGTAEIELNVTNINNLPYGNKWDGIEFGKKIGVWFHFGDHLNAHYNNGKLTKFDLGQHGWVDFKNKHSDKEDPCTLFPGVPGCEPTEVSEPGTLALAGLGLIGLAATRRRRA